jgi:two-component system response regulator DegU
LILQGKSNREIEELLFISGHTVKNHIYDIYRKLDIKSRSQLANLIMERQTELTDSREQGP